MLHSNIRSSYSPFNFYRHSFLFCIKLLSTFNFYTTFSFLHYNMECYIGRKTMRPYDTRSSDLRTWIWARLTSVQSQLSVEKAIAKRAVAMIPVMVARDNVTAEQGILIQFASLFLFFFLRNISLAFSSLSFVSFTSHSTAMRCYYQLYGTTASIRVTSEIKMLRNVLRRREAGSRQ